MTKTHYFRTITVFVAVSAAVVAMLLMSVSAGAVSTVFVTDVSPDGGATSVAADSNITATFSKDMRASTINGTTFYLKKESSSTTIPAQLIYNSTSKTVTLNPKSNLEAGARYTATIKGGKRGVKASNGDRLGGTRDSTATFANGKVTWSFTVANDSPPPPPSTPSVDLDAASDSGASSTDNLTNDTTPTFTGTAETGNTVKIYVDGTEKGSGTATGGSYSITTSTLTSGTHSVTAKATDAAGNPSAESSMLSVTVDTSAPTVGSTVSPVNTATGVATNTNVEAPFSEAIDSSSLTDQTFTLGKDSSPPVAADVSYDSASKKATLNPDSALETNTTYEATITTGVKDQAGNALDQDYTWSFTTAPPPFDACPYQPGDQPEGTVCKEGVEITPIELRPSFSGWCSTYVLGGPWAIDAGWFTISNYTPDPVYIAEVSITGPDAQYFSSAAQQYIAQQGPYELASAHYVSDQIGLQTQRDFLGTRQYNAVITYKDENGNTVDNPVSVTATTTCHGI